MHRVWVGLCAGTHWSTRCPSRSSTLPCQCALCRSTSAPSTNTYQRTLRAARPSRALLLKLGRGADRARHAKRVLASTPTSPVLGAGQRGGTWGMK